MAIYHLSVQVINRKDNRSAVFAAAYRAGEHLVDERLNKIADYTKKRRPLHTEILAPLDAPAWVYNRERLWNAVEAREKRKDAQLAREFNVALPAELSIKQQIELIKRYVQEQFVKRGMVADISINKPPKSGSHLNFYAHIMLTTREINLDGFGSKNRDWNSPSLLKEWRAAWAEYANEALAKAGRAERIDHRTLQAQGLDREPTIHLGPNKASETELELRKNIEDKNKQIIALNKERAVRLASRSRTSSEFRSLLIEAYEGQCAITGSNVLQVLEAVYICPYHTIGDEFSQIANGLLLRSDIHRLFDLYQLTVHPETKEVCIAPELKNTSYGELEGTKLRLPKDETLYPKTELLERHYNQCAWISPPNGVKVASLSPAAT